MSVFNTVSKVVRADTGLAGYAARGVIGAGVGGTVGALGDSGDRRQGFTVGALGGLSLGAGSRFGQNMMRGKAGKAAQAASVAKKMTAPQLALTGGKESSASYYARQQNRNMAAQARESSYSRVNNMSMSQRMGR